MEKDPELKLEYNKFMTEYENLGHMKAVSMHDSYEKCVNYIPHHGIWQNADDRKKLRVVFNASKSTTSGYSLNDLLYSGKKLQNDMMSILIRWRRHRLAFCTDIKMMFRQIRIDDQDADYQRIVWRRPGETVVTHFKLLTVTYGTKCAPFLAGRVMRDLALKGIDQYPQASSIVLKDAYVDDLFSGGDDIQSVIELRNELIALLKNGNLPLRKWAANHPKILEDLSDEERLRPKWINFQTDGPISTLGVAWDAASDEFRFQAPSCEIIKNPTKRHVLSKIAQLFDPVGWLAPVVITAKIFMRTLWQRKLQWDDKLEGDLLENWNNFLRNLPEVSQIRLPRWLGTSITSTVELHGFGDASKNAYAAVIYIRIKNRETFQTCLLTSKTRVAPVKTRSTPQLELCAAVLVNQLLNRIMEDLELKNIPIYLWSDNTTVLNWIQDPDPGRLPVFVANRVSEIQRTSSPSSWNYVNTSYNPADIASRGMSAKLLAKNDLWWHGPNWLQR